MRGRFLIVLAVCVDVVLPTGCSAMGPADTGPSPDAGGNDVSLSTDAKVSPTHLVVVNALDQSLGALSDDDVRVCLGTGPGDRPLPEDPTHPVPLSNYPGIPLGGGVDLGQYLAPSTIYVISAKLQKDNYPGGPAQVACNEILSPGASAKPYLAVSVPPGSGQARLVVLLDDTSDGGAAAAAATLDEATYDPDDAGAAVHAQLGAFGPWARQSVTVDSVDPTDASASLAAFDGGSVAPPQSLLVDVSPFDGRALRFSSAGAVPSELVQSFQDIQSVSDPTTSASVFYGQRANFVFLALGAPGAADAAAAPPSFESRALHIVAIPYVP